MNIIHSSPNTEGLRCDGQPCFEVVIRKKKHSEQERYWCGQIHSYFDPTSFPCPKDQQHKKDREYKFNRNGRL